MREAVIVSTARTGIGRAYKGSLNATKSPSMMGHVIAQAVVRAGIEGAEVEEGTQFADQHALAERLVADRADDQHVGALLEPREREGSLFVGETAAHERAVLFRLQLEL